MAFTSKTTEETVRYGFNFSNLLEPDESLATSSWSILPTSGGTDASAASMLFSTPIYTLSPVVKHLVTLGVSGVTYLVVVEITTDKGQVLQSSQYLEVT
jgi:hypothetical protein